MADVKGDFEPKKGEDREWNSVGNQRGVGGPVRPEPKVGGYGEERTRGGEFKREIGQRLMTVYGGEVQEAGAMGMDDYIDMVYGDGELPSGDRELEAKLLYAAMEEAGVDKVRLRSVDPDEGEMAYQMMVGWVERGELPEDVAIGAMDLYADYLDWGVMPEEDKRAIESGEGMDTRVDLMYVTNAKVREGLNGKGGAEFVKRLWGDPDTKVLIRAGSEKHPFRLVFREGYDELAVSFGVFASMLRVNGHGLPPGELLKRRSDAREMYEFLKRVKVEGKELGADEVVLEEADREVKVMVDEHDKGRVDWESRDTVEVVVDATGIKSDKLKAQLGAFGGLEALERTLGSEGTELELRRSTEKSRKKGQGRESKVEVVIKPKKGMGEPLVLPATAFASILKVNGEPIPVERVKDRAGLWMLLESKLRMGRKKLGKVVMAGDTEYGG